MGSVLAAAACRRGKIKFRNKGGASWRSAQRSIRCSRAVLSAVPFAPQVTTRHLCRVNGARSAFRVIFCVTVRQIIVLLSGLSFVCVLPHRLRATDSPRHLPPLASFVISLSRSDPVSLSVSLSLTALCSARAARGVFIIKSVVRETMPRRWSLCMTMPLRLELRLPLRAHY